MKPLIYGSKQYFITRSDLAPGIKASQLVHATIEFALAHRENLNHWHEVSNHVCLLEVKDQDELTQILYKAYGQNIVVSCFRETDMDNELTAIVLEASSKSKKLVRHLPLAFK